MSSKVAKLVSTYREHLTVPWQAGLAAIQRVIFAVYDKADESRLRANVGEFELATQQAGKQWMLLDLTDAFPEWMAAQEYRDAYFESPEDLAGYQTGELTEFVADLNARLTARIQAEAGPDTVVALLGVGTLFGLARVSSVIEGVKEAVTGRLFVFFPGEYHPENHTYRLLDARDGWNYLAVPLLAQD
ncbi:BREX protein BrxB domain-containing protein [Paraburkholderia agricolaris]|uniref:BREX protein BrxB domain-containing protein n=1 Tax=Paraburkholderia agricolaris TaxID=2152888 RepID=UPI001291CAC9|nr:BREX protein BrxB domain-containing protein [Paraburkholderia agricolaris]